MDCSVNDGYTGVLGLVAVGRVVAFFDLLDEQVTAEGFVPLDCFLEIVKLEALQLGEVHDVVPVDLVGVEVVGTGVLLDGGDHG